MPSTPDSERAVAPSGGGYLPNGKVFGEMIVNMSQSGHRRIELVFGVDDDDDLNTALRLLIECAQANQSVLNDPPPWAKVTSLGDNAVNVTLRCWASSDDYVDARFDLTKAIKETLEAHGLSFPYPHQVTINRPGLAKVSPDEERTPLEPAPGA